jgi:hypothetical protein
MEEVAIIFVVLREKPFGTVAAAVVEAAVQDTGGSCFAGTNQNAVFAKHRRSPEQGRSPAPHLLRPNISSDFAY